MDFTTDMAAAGALKGEPKSAKKRTKPKPKLKKKAKSKTKKVPKRKTAKAKKPARKSKVSGSVVRSERLDMRLSKAEKAKINAKAKKTRRTVTNLVIEAIEKIK